LTHRRNSREGVKVSAFCALGASHAIVSNHFVQPVEITKGLGAPSPSAWLTLILGGCTASKQTVLRD